jgi:hypothetical protein
LKGSANKGLQHTCRATDRETIIAAGHFDAYNYWLFQGARPDEFNQWAKEHQAKYQGWLDWLAKNKFMVQTPDFQRLYLVRGRH